MPKWDRVQRPLNENERIVWAAAFVAVVQQPDEEREDFLRRGVKTAHQAVMNLREADMATDYQDGQQRVSSHEQRHLEQMQGRGEWMPQQYGFR